MGMCLWGRAIRRRILAIVLIRYHWILTLPRSRGPRQLYLLQVVFGEHNTIYQRRRDLVIDTLNNIGLEAKPPKASLYIWAKVPEGYTSIEFANNLLEEVGVVVTPGVGYGRNGEGYVRLSLTIPDAELEKGLTRLAEWHGLSRVKK